MSRHKRECTHYTTHKQYLVVTSLFETLFLGSPVLRLISEVPSYHFLLHLDGWFTIRPSDQPQLNVGVMGQNKRDNHLLKQFGAPAYITCSVWWGCG